MKLLQKLSTLLLFFSLLMGGQALAEGNLTSYAAPAYDARHGGRQVTLEELRQDPVAFYRSEAAYANARAVMGGIMELNLTDQRFKQLLRSDRVSVKACNEVFKGAFTLAAIDSKAKAYWAKPRRCDAGETIILLDGIPIMSLACLNPIKLPEMDCKCGTIYYEWRQQHPKG